MKTILKHVVVALFVFPSAAFAWSGQDSQEAAVFYGQFGAVGDGLTDDFESIIKAHAAANESGRTVRADPGATYYIGGAGKTAQIRTDTDWGDAKFLIDDTNVENRNSPVFHVGSAHSPGTISGVKTLRKNQEKLDLSLPQDCFVIATDATTKRYIRYGRNQNSGSAQIDVFLLDKDGNVDPETPLVWDFDNVTKMTTYPLDAERLTVRGGHFTTIANRAQSRYAYYARGIQITRSRVLLEGLRHEITGELEHGAPYGGFVTISNCSHVSVENCRFSGHKTYTTIGSAELPVSMGSYDISVNRSAHITFKNCDQFNDIHDTKLWGIFGSNDSKDITFDTVKFSRFDAHRGVTGAKIRDSVLGHQGINLIGSGLFLVENTEVHSGNFINLRSDYGSTFQGELVVRNCRFVPRGGAKSDAVLIGGSNSGQHDFGYACFMPEKITLDGLLICDENPVNNYRGPRIFAAFNRECTDERYAQEYPYEITREIEIRNLEIKSGKDWILSDNPFLFRNVRVVEK